MEEAGADQRRGQTSPHCGPGFDAVLATPCLEVSTRQPQFWQILPFTHREPARLAAPACPTKLSEGECRTGRPLWVVLCIAERPLFVPQTLGMASSLQAQGVETWCRNHFPASQTLSLEQNQGSAGSTASSINLTPWVLISGLILARWVSLDRSLQFYLALHLCAVVQPNWPFPQSTLGGNVDGQLKIVCCCYFCCAWHRAAFLVDVILNA